SVDKTAPIDCAAPSVSNVRAAVSGSGATITWNTNEAATSIVRYGTVLPAGSSASATGLVTTHGVVLSAGLSLAGPAAVPPGVNAVRARQPLVHAAVERLVTSDASELNKL